MTMKMRVFEAFAGIGAQRRALINVNANFEIAGMAEWFIPAIISYQVIHNGFNKKSINKKVNIQEMKDYLSSLTLSMDSKKPVNPNYWNRINEDKLRLIYSAVQMSQKEGNIFDVRKLHERTLS